MLEPTAIKAPRYRRIFFDCRKTFKEGGLKAVIKKYGWKVFAAFFFYYLTRDLLLYVLLPYLITRGFFA